MSYDAGQLSANLSLDINKYLQGVKEATAATEKASAQITKSFEQARRAAEDFAESMRKDIGGGYHGNGGDFNFSSPWSPKAQENIAKTSTATKKLRNDFKDLARIVSGILISQAFYRVTNAIQNSISSLVEFSSHMEDAAVSLQYFLGSKDDVQAFLVTMQQFAAITPFTTEQAIDLSKRLMAAGFAATQVKSVMMTLTDAASATGGTAEQMDRIVLALAQIKTNGKLAGQEVRQLAEANIPIYQILQQQLGLTGKQMQNLGKLGIDSNTAIAAILQGLQRYKGASVQLSETLHGMWTTIQDDIKIVASDATRGAYGSLESFVRNVRNLMERARDDVQKRGFGGLFRDLVPQQLQQSIINIVGSFKLLGQAISNVWQIIKPGLELITGVFIKGLGIALPIVTGLAKGATALALAMANAAPWVKYLTGALAGILIANLAARSLMFLWSVTRLGTICAAVGEAVVFLAKAIGTLAVVMTKSRLGLVITAISAALLYFAFSSKTVSNWLDVLMQKIGAITNMNLGGIFDPKDQKELQAAIDKYNKQFDGMNKNLKNVGKNAEAAGKKVKDKFAASFDELYQIPDQLDKVNDNLTDTLGDMTLPKIDGFDVGNSGAKLPDPGKGFDWSKWFVPPVVGKANNGDKGGGNSGGKTTEEVEVEIIPPDMSRFDAFEKEMKSRVETISANVKATFQDMADAITNWSTTTTATIKKWVDDNSLELDGWSTTTTASFVKWVEDNTKSFGDWATQAYGSVVQWATDSYAKFSEFLNNTLADAGSWVTNMIGSVSDWSTQTYTQISTWVNNALDSIEGWATDTESTISDWVTNRITDIDNWATTTYVKISTWATDAGTSIKNWSTNAITDIGKWFNTTSGNITSWVKTTGKDIEQWGIDAGKDISDWVTNAASAIYKWANNTGSNIVSWVNGGISNVAKWVDATGQDISDWVNGTAKGFEQWATNVGQNFASFANGTYDVIAGWAKGSWDAMSNWLSGTASGVADWAKGTIGTIVTWAQSAWSTIKSLASSVGKEIGSWFGSSGTAITNAYSGMKNWVADNKSWLVPVAVGAVTVGAIAATVATGGAAAPALLALETGGIVDQDQLVRIGEGNKREAVIPLENSTYMQPFSKAVASDLAGMLGGAGPAQADTRPILYVGTLIADDRSLKELYRKMEVIGVQENQRKGLS